MSGHGLLFLVVMMLGCSGARPTQHGLNGGRLAPCPDSPNCISSQSTDRRHAIEPLRYDGTADQARKDLLEALGRMRRSRIVTSERNYLHATFTSLIFRFVDDAEFLFEDALPTIHVRSASRVGSSDFGVNRKRMEAIRSRFNALQKERT